MALVASRRSFISMIGAGTVLSLSRARAANVGIIEAKPGDNLLTEKYLASFQPSDVDPDVTAKFHELSRTRPWLNLAKNSIGILKAALNQNGQKIFNQREGSIVILDDDGTVEFTGHQYRNLQRRSDGNVTASAVMSFMRGKTEIVFPNIKIDAVDSRRDVAIGTIAPADWKHRKKRFGFGPVTLGSTDIDMLIGKEVVLVGYPIVDALPGRPLLHATTGFVYGFGDSELVHEDDAYVSLECREFTSAPALNGISGGAAFVDGGYIGSVSSGNHTSEPNPDPKSSIIPVGYQLNLEQQVYPDRTAKFGIIRPIAGLPQSCRASANQFAIR